MTTENNGSVNSSLYRGNCEALKGINEADIDISVLVQSTSPAFPHEPARKFFPVRSQLTWFRLKNRKGNVVTEIHKNDEFVAVVKATIIGDDGNVVANAHGSADATNDGVNGFKLIETAESRAIARALDFAGYGCQLDLNTFEDSQPVPAPDSTPVGNSETQFPNEAPAEPQPGTVKGTKKVSANTGSGIVDISELEKSADTAPRGKGKGKTSKPPVAGEQPPAPGAASGDGAAKPRTEMKRKPADEPAAPKTVPEPSREAVGDSVNNEAEKPSADADSPSADVQGGSGGNAVPANNAGSSEDASATGPEPSQGAAESTVNTEAEKSSAKPESHAGEAQGGSADNAAPVQGAACANDAERLVMEHIAAAVAAGETDVVLDARFFPEGASLDGAALNGTGKETKMNNLELQLAIDFLRRNPALVPQQVYPADKGDFFGKTFAEVSEMSAPSYFEEIIGTCVKLYRKHKVPAYAAALILNAEPEEGGGK